MTYGHTAIPDEAVPKAADPQFQHLLDTYASETNKVHSVWQHFSQADMSWAPHVRSSSVADILKHQLLSERRFFGEFLGTPEPAASDVLPTEHSVLAYREQLVRLARPRLAFFAEQNAGWWLDRVPFFDVQRERVWVFWRRVLHTCHHRTQLTMYLRLMDRSVPATYGPTADETWQGADPTHTVDAAQRR